MVLNRILRSPGLQASHRQRRILAYLTEETLAGRAERLKAYTIGTDVLGRNSDFDPQADPIVRTQVSDLRRCLERYYLTDGRTDELRITIPKGSYIPQFEPWPPPVAPGNRRRSRRVILLAASAVLLLSAFTLAIRVSALHDNRLQPAPPDGLALAPSVRIEQVVNASHDRRLDPFAAALTAELRSALVPFKSLDVYVRNTEKGFDVPVEYRLQASVLRLKDDIRVTAQLVDSGTGLIMWSREYVTFPNPSAAGSDSVARQIARSLGDPYGTLYELEGKASENTADLRRCMLNFYTYVENWSRDLHRQLRNCHEAVVDRFPAYSEAWAHLALLYLDEFKYAYNPVPGARSALQRTADAAHRAMAADPENARAHLALALAFWFKHDLASFSVEADRARALNPNDPLVAAEVGTRRFLRGDYDGGLALVREALAQGSGRPPRYHDVIAIDAYLKRDYALALDEALRSGLKDRPLARIILVAIYGKLGRRDDAAAVWDALRKEMPQTAAAPRQTMIDREWIPDIVDALMSGIDQAGVLQQSKHSDPLQVAVPLTFSRSH